MSVFRFHLDGRKRLPVPQVCPYCERENDASTMERTAREGDINICFGCCEPSICTESGRLRKTEPGELPPEVYGYAARLKAAKLKVSREMN